MKDWGYILLHKLKPNMLEFGETATYKMGPAYLGDGGVCEVD